MMKKSLLLLLLLCLAGCAGKRGSAAPVPPTPLPPQTENSAPQTVSLSKTVPNVNTSMPDAQKPDADGAYLTEYPSADRSGGPRRNEPSELAALLDMKGAGSEKDTAVSLLRPSAIREAAQLVTLQTAVSWRYKQLVAVTESHAAIMDTAFDFSPLLMTQGDALIMPPVLTRAGASMRIEKPDTATTSKTSYELLAPARYVSTIPNWREFLMLGGFPAPEKPNPAVMPKNADERAIWRSAVREAWMQGVAEADQLYTDNVAGMVRQYRGVMLYHLLTAQHLLSRVNTASANLGLKTSDQGNKLNVGQKVYRITAPSAFTVTGTPESTRK